MLSYSQERYYLYKIWDYTCLTILLVVIEQNSASAQQIQVPGGVSVNTGSGGASGTINNVLQFIIDQMLAVGALLSTVFALGVIMAIKFGWMERSKIKDFAWYILAFVSLPTLIPAIYQFALSS